MNKPLDWRIPLDAEDWQCDWESSRRFQIRYWASLPLRDKIAAIEEMEEFGRAMIERRRQRGLPYIDPDTGERVCGALVREEPPKPEAGHETK
ncbi:MAG TPA: hypothetical protein VFA65_14710 [Bryobacteraceae bacterium]|jgi:hypothetical protein|nr:hypothetical protein [Bryobacteraceae bacterium]